MMKNIIAIISGWMLMIIAISCRDKKDPGRIYMPDMAYSRAYETYAPIDTLKSQGINYNALPVKGTIKRGQLFPFSLEKDKEGDSTNYKASKQIQNPLTELNVDQMREAERLYLVDCGICHGPKLDGNGPLYNDGKGPYAAAPKNFIADPIVSVMPEGQMFYSITYGKGQMGSYASQLSTLQRWMVIHYIKNKQAAAKVASQAAKPATDSAAKK